MTRRPAKDDHEGTPCIETPTTPTNIFTLGKRRELWFCYSFLIEGEGGLLMRVPRRWRRIDTVPLFYRESLGVKCVYCFYWRRYLAWRRASRWRLVSAPCSRWQPQTFLGKDNIHAGCFRTIPRKNTSPWNIICRGMWVDPADNFVPLLGNWNMRSCRSITRTQAW